MSEVAAPPAVVFDDVWKKFRRGERYDSLRDMVPALVKRFSTRGRPQSKLDKSEFWALKGVSFEVAQGEALGLIGANGAGKSTTLKILTKILRPDRGRCQVRGRLGALIEVAAGFHPDLTGMENIYLQGAIMGMQRLHIQERMDSILDFSGIEAFMDTPVKRFSSGMQARLGFAIAAHLEPDVLLVDEVLSVGDFNFQAKCLKQMQRILSSGTTVIFVSHQMPTVLSLCQRVIYLSGGTVAADGPAAQAINAYVKAGGRWTFEKIDEPCIKAVEVEVNRPNGDVLAQGDTLELSVTLAASKDCRVSPGMFVARQGLEVVNTSLTKFSGEYLCMHAGEVRTVTWRFDLNLPGGVYELGHFVEDQAGLKYHEFAPGIFAFSLADDRRVVSECFVNPEVMVN